MTPQEFAAKWAASKLGERAGSQSHFIDLCRLLDEPTPAEVDPDGTFFTFEKGALKTGGGKGWADVWKRGCFAWEYKGKHHDLDDALGQLLRYGAALENPPLLIVSDMDTIRIHTNFTNTVQQVHAITLDDIAVPDQLRKLHWAFREPDRLKPGITREGVTKSAAEKFAAVAQRLRARGNDPMRVAHFVNRMLFCLFAEDIKLLPDRLFQQMLEAALPAPERFHGMAQELFAALAEDGGRIGFRPVPWFNGGLFDGDDALQLEREDLGDVLDAAALDWSAIEPSIFGTLFERGLDPDKRSQLGAHYTDGESIRKVIDPVVLRPLAAEWDAVKAEMQELTARARAVSGAARTNREKRRRAVYQAFRERLATYRVLDPACGSGNFLYMALLGLKDLEHRVIYEAETLGEPPDDPRVGPQSVMGIEINPYAAELARVSIWIGEIQWQLRHSYGYTRSPVLRSLERIECRDAVLNADGSEADWPAADAVVGNPPFLGAKLMNRVLGKPYTARLRAAYAGRLKGFSDLVCYWFDKARVELEAGRAKRAGLVATSSIRGGTNRPVLDAISRSLAIHEAWSELPWTVEGANVEVSIVVFCREELKPETCMLDGVPVGNVNPDLSTGVDVTVARPQPENDGVSFLGIQTSGPIDVPGDVARAMLKMPTNPNGRRNAEVLKPYWNGDDVTGRPRDVWLIDLPPGLDRAEAAAYEAPFERLLNSPYDPDEPDVSLESARAGARDRHARERWWEPYWPRPEMRERIRRLSRYIATPETAQHRIFVWLRPPVLPDKNLIVVAREDDATFGVLHSRHHAAWSNRLGTSLEDRPRYTSTTTFATFPFPDGMTPDLPEARNPAAAKVAAAARRLDGLREAWLNPPDLVRATPEAVKGFPDRPMPRDKEAEGKLKKRTLTNLYNARPQWLVEAHRALDDAVSDAYGWPTDLTDDGILRRLLDLNLRRADAMR